MEPAANVKRLVVAISAQQYSAVELLHRAMTQDEIAQVLEITPRTVAHHLREARRHTGARNGVALALMFERGQVIVKRTREVSAAPSSMAEATTT